MCTNDESRTSNRREKLVASLQVLLSNDDIDLEMFRPGSSWCHIAELATEQQRQPTQVPRQMTHAGSAASDQNSARSEITPPAPCDDDMILDAVLRDDLSLGDTFNLDPTPSWLAIKQDGSATPTFNNHGISSMSADGGLVEAEMGYALHTDFTSFESFEAALGSDQHNDTMNCPSVPFSSSSSYPTPPMFNNPNSGTPPVWSISTDMTDTWLLSQTPSDDDGQAVNKSATCFIPQAQQSQIKHEPKLAGSKEPTRAPSSRPPKRQRAHYHIERRYRAGLNEKFDALRDLMEARKRSQNSQLQQDGSANSPTSGDSAETGPGTNREGKMNKAEVLHEAVLCVRELEEENEILMDHFKQLLRRLRTIRSAI